MKYPNIDPVLLKLGPIEIRWYGLLYVIGFVIAYVFVKKLYKMRNVKMGNEDYENFLFSLMLGVIVGGRLGYVLFYNLGYYLHNPLEIILPFSFENGFHFTGISGMSFHGGTLGVIIFGYLFCKRKKL